MATPANFGLKLAVFEAAQGNLLQYWSSQRERISFKFLAPTAIADNADGQTQAGNSASHAARHRTRRRLLALTVSSMAAAWVAAFAIAPVAGAATGSPGHGFLPDNRSWELVSPPDKNGSDVVPDTWNTRASATGDAIEFASLVGFGDTAGGGIAFEYVARRTASPGTQGWATHGIDPPLPTMGFADGLLGGPHHTQGLSTDISTGIFFSTAPLTADPMVENVANLYIRRDLNTPGVAAQSSPQLITPCPACSDGIAPDGPLSETQKLLAPPIPVGASQDFSKAYFASRLNLTTGASGTRFKLYRWDHASGLTRAGVIPASGATCAGEDCVNPAGGGSNPSNTSDSPVVSMQERLFESTNAVSRDGSKAFFIAPGGNPAGCQGVCSTFMRDDLGTAEASDDTTTKLNESERTDCANGPDCGGNGIPDPAPDPGGAQRAIFQWATPNGRFAFFVSGEALTDDAPTGADTDANVYRYDTSKPATDANNLEFVGGGFPPVASVTGWGMLGGSADGATLYYLTDSHIVRWHDGVNTTVADIPSDTRPLAPRTPPIQNFGGYEASVSPDGRYAAFVHNDSTSGESPTGYNNPNHRPQFYLYDAEANGGAGELVCASCNPSGAPPTSDAFVNVFQNDGALIQQAHVPRWMSSDGRYVFFTTADKLVPEDSNSPCPPGEDSNNAPACTDAYVFDSQEQSVSLLSRGTGAHPSYFLDASADGRNAFILTRERLSAWDVDQAYDIYDARVDGGLPEPVSGPPPCSSTDTCHGSSSGTPPTEPIESDAEGDGNVLGDTKDCSSARAKLAKAKRKLRAADSVAERRKARRAVRKAKRKLEACLGGRS